MSASVQTAGATAHAAISTVHSLDRLAIVARDYPAGVERAEILRAVNALPGPRMTENTLRFLASKMELKRPDWYVQRVLSQRRFPPPIKGPRPVKATERRCLCCSKMFPSVSVGNRICKPCKESADWG